MDKPSADNIFSLPSDVLADEPDRRFINALARGLDVLRAFQPGDGYLGNQEIAQRTGLPKSSVSRLTYTLTKLGYLIYAEPLEKYQLGSGVLALGYAFTANLAIRQLARPLMQELANRSGAAVGLANRDRLKMIYLEYCAPGNVMAIRNQVGDRIALASSALGRAYLAVLPDSERAYFLHHIVARNPDCGPELEQQLASAQQQLQQRGYCCGFGDWEQDINGIAVPLVSGNQIFSFNAGGPAYRFSPEYLEAEVAPQLKALVRNLEATLDAGR